MYKVQKMAGVLGVILAVFALVGCELEVAKNQKEDNTIVISQQTENPSFPVNSGESYKEPIKLSVDAKTDQPGELTYQWYTNTSGSNKGGTPIQDATESSYTVTIDDTVTVEKTYFYYVVITLTNDDKTVTKSSAPIKVTIKATSDITDFQNTVTVNLTKAQYVRGFGGMSTPWDNAPDDNLDDFETMFNPEKLGYNISRIMIPPDDTDIDEMMRAFVANETRFSGSYFSTNNGLPERNKDNSTYYEKVKIVNKYGGYVLASPWSPPAEWKTNGSTNGGSSRLKTENYLDFARYLKRYGELMYEQGAPVYSISLQNEFTYPPENYEGCNYSETEHANWWKQAGNFLDGVKGWGGGREIPKVQAMSGESHNEIVKLNSILANDVRGYIDLLGRHIYGAGLTDANFKSSAQNHATDPKEIWMSEHNINSGTPTTNRNDSTWNYVWMFMNDIDFTIRLNDENAFIWWTAKRFYSMIGDATYGTTDGEVLPRGYGLSHYAKFAKETGRVGVKVEGSAKGVNPTSYSNTNTGPKISAFVTLTDDFYAKPVETRNARWKGIGADALPLALTVNDITAISLVMYTPTANSGSGGTNMETVKIQLPAGFTIKSATAIRSNSESPRPKDASVLVGTDKNTAYVTLPVSTILSVRFTK